MLQDDDPRKWELATHTSAKHQVLARYMKAWLPILARGAKARGLRAEMVIVDGFAGRGRYVEGEPGSPLIFRRIASDVVGAGTADQVELFFVERDPANHAELVRALGDEPPARGVVEHPPIHDEFARAAPRILQRLDARARPSFWFVDPFGFSGLPLGLIREILRRSRAEVFITFMVQAVNRFLDSPNHRIAIAELLGLAGAELERAIEQVEASPQRVSALRDLYQRRLHEAAGATYVWPFRVAAAGGNDTVYYLMHGSTHIKAFREMKDAAYDVGGRRYAFLGKDDFAVTGQAELPIFDTETWELKARLLDRLAGQEWAYDPPGQAGQRSLLNELYPDPAFHMWIEKHFHEALTELISEGKVEKVPVDTRGRRGLRGRDKLRFPAAKQSRF